MTGILPKKVTQMQNNPLHLLSCFELGLEGLDHSSILGPQKTGFLNVGTEMKLQEQFDPVLFLSARHQFQVYQAL